MRLWHGTSEKRAQRISREGLVPRGHSGLSNWRHTAESRPEAVYLTDAYPLYFAGAVPEEGRWAVVEVDTDNLDLRRLRPDEDALALAREPATRHTSVQRRARNSHALARRSPRWRESLQVLGTCAYEGVVPMAALTRIALFRPDAHPEFALMAKDAVIAPANYALMRERYRALVAWLFGDPVDPSVLVRRALDEADERRQRADWERLLAERSGVSVLAAGELAAARPV